MFFTQYLMILKIYHLWQPVGHNLSSFMNGRCRAKDTDWCSNDASAHHTEMCCRVTGANTCINWEVLQEIWVPVVRVQEGVDRGQKVEESRTQWTYWASPYHTLQAHLSLTVQHPPHSLLLIYTQSLTSLPHHSSPGLSGAVFCPNAP